VAQAADNMIVIIKNLIHQSWHYMFSSIGR